MIENLEGEIWKDVAGYEGIYKVSNMGRILSIGRVIKFARVSRYFKESHLLKLHVETKHLNRVSCGLAREGKTQSQRVHRLVAEAFIPNPDNKPQINHINGNPSDNRVENLEWCTQSENNIHSFRVLGRKPCKTMLGKIGKLHTMSIPVNLVDSKGNILASYESMNLAAQATGIKIQNISGWVKGKVKEPKWGIWEIQKSI